MPVERALGTPYVYFSMPVTIAIGNAIGYDRNVFFFHAHEKGHGHAHDQWHGHAYDI